MATQLLDNAALESLEKRVYELHSLVFSKDLKLGKKKVSYKLLPVW